MSFLYVGQIIWFIASLRNSIYSQSTVVAFCNTYFTEHIYRLLLNPYYDMTPYANAQSFLLDLNRCMRCNEQLKEFYNYCTMHFHRTLWVFCSPICPGLSWLCCDIVFYISPKHITHKTKTDC